MTNNLAIDNLCIEVTRRCNMMCEHCLRGDSQNIDITHKIINEALKNIQYINDITFTGGEPTLHLEAISYTLNVCKTKNIEVDHIYIVTNGTNITDEFIRILIDWYLYCDDIDELFGVAISQDPFHADIDKTNIRKLKTLRFFHEDDKKNDFKYGLINEGRATNITSYTTHNLNTNPTLYGSLDNDILKIYDSEVYIAANGDIKIGCDWAYDNNVTQIGNVTKDNLYDCLTQHYTEE